MKRRKKRDKITRKFCGYCGKWRRMYETEFYEHQEDCEKELVLWYRESNKFYEDDEGGDCDGKDSSN